MKRLSLAFGASFLFLSSLHASQWGPVFPSHRFPTDQSFHLIGSLAYGSETSLYNDKAAREKLDGTLSRIRFTIEPDYQPSRQFAIGAYLNVDSLKLSGSGGGSQVTKSGLSDQYIFGEFRLVDEVGYSYGFGTVFKFPLYTTPKNVTGADPFLLLGDGQIDATLVASTEIWPWDSVRFIGDLGVTYRTDDHAAEIPFQFGMEYMSPKFNLGIALLGNLSFNNDKATQSPTSQQIETLTGDTNYVFAKNPQVMLIQLKAEYAFTHSWAVTANYDNTVWGKNSPFFAYFGAGVSYRFFEPSLRRRSAREVGIETDDSSKDFEGEVQEGIEDQSLQDGAPLDVD